jgi:hypothetical protein
LVTDSSSRPAPSNKVTVVYLALVMALAGLAMLPAYGIVTLTIADQADEYAKATTAYGPNVPSDVEGGSPLFIILSTVPMIAQCAAGVGLAIAIAWGRRLPRRTALIAIGSMTAVLIATYVIVQLTLGPSWPPPAKDLAIG